MRPFVHVRRDYFNEQSFLIALLVEKGLLAEMPRAEFYAGECSPHLEAAYARSKLLPKRPSPPSRTYEVDGGRVVAARIEALASEGRTAPSSPPHLSSKIVSGYLLKSAQQTGCILRWKPHSAAAANTPDILLSEDKLRTMGICVASSRSEVSLNEALAEPGVADFVALLLKLREKAGKMGSFEGGGVRADGLDYACHLFSFDNGASEICVTRAPGRLDVMGGIADYSGSLVLQLPIAEACFCALQLQPCKPSASPQLRIVSVGDADEGRARNPFFQVELRKLLSLTPSKAREHFESRSNFKVGCVHCGRVHYSSGRKSRGCKSL